MGTIFLPIFGVSNASHDGTEKEYDFTAPFTLPLGPIGNEIGPIQLTIYAYKSDLLEVTWNGVACDRSSGPFSFPVVLPHDLESGPFPHGVITVGIPDTPAWVQGQEDMLAVRIRRHAQPVEEGDRNDLHVSADIFYHVAGDNADPAPLWCWGANADGQQGDGTTLDNPTPRSSEDADDPFIDAVDIAGGGTEAGTRAMLRRAIDNYQRAAGSNADGELLTRDGDPTLWTFPTMHSRGPENVPRAVWGFQDLFFGANHVIAHDDWELAGIYGWGGNDQGQLDIGSLGAASEPTMCLRPVDYAGDYVPQPVRARSIYAGDGFTIATDSQTGLGPDLGLTADAEIYGAGDAALLGGAAGGSTLTPLVTPGIAHGYTIPNQYGSGIGGGSGAGHTVAAGYPENFQPILRSWGRNDMGQCGIGSAGGIVSAPVDITNFWGSPYGSFAIACGWKGTSLLVTTDLAYPDDVQLWTWGYPHPAGGAGGMDPVSGLNYAVSPIRMEMPDRARPNDIPAPVLADYDYEGGAEDFAADTAEWVARPPFVYDFPQYILHGRGHRMLGLVAALPDEDGHTCITFYTQGWNDHGQLGNGAIANVHDAGWNEALSVYGVPRFSGPGRIKPVVAWDTNYIIGFECKIASMPMAFVQIG